MPKVKTKRDQKAAAEKAWGTLRKRLAAEKREALASGKAPPPSPAQKAAATLRKNKAAREAQRKTNEAMIQKNLGRSISDAHAGSAEIAAAGQGRVDARRSNADGAPNLGQQGPDAQSSNAEMTPPANVGVTPMNQLPATSPSDTTMRAAFEKAGVNTARVELEQHVKSLLARNNNDPARMLGAFDTLILRRRDLRQVLLVEYATRLAGADAALGEAAAENIAEAQQAIAKYNGGKGTFKRAPVQHKRSEAQKAAAREAMAGSLGIWSRKIGDRAIGELSWGELGTLKQVSITEAGKHTLAGMYRAADAILIGKIQDYAQVRDPTTLVRNVVPEDVLTKFNHEAAKQAPRVVDLGRVAYEGTLTKQIEQRV
jgi:hypothetical protein